MKLRPPKVPLPPGCFESIELYVMEGISGGDFLNAVMENNLREAFGRADNAHRDALFEIVSYCYNNIPGECWGDKDRVIQWMHHQGMKGKE